MTSPRGSARQIALMIALLGAACGRDDADRLSELLDSLWGADAVAAETWTFVPVPGMACANDTPTGLGLNLTSRSAKLFIYLDGGGGCWDAETCADPFHVRNANLGGFDGGSLQRVMVTGVPEDVPPIPPGYGAMGIWDRGSALNPFRDHSYVYVPYCTADLYLGDLPRSPATGLSHVGHANVLHALSYLAAALPPDARRQVVLGGSSAGAYGALWSFPRAQAAFRPVAVDLVTESGPPLPDPYLSASLEGAWAEAWGLERTRPPEAPATRLFPVFRWMAQAHPDSHFSLISMTGDASLALFVGLPLLGARSLSQGLAALRRGLEESPNVGFFYVWSVEHTVIHKAPADWSVHWPPPWDDEESLSQWLLRRLP